MAYKSFFDSANSPARTKFAASNLSPNAVGEATSRLPSDDQSGKNFVSTANDIERTDTPPRAPSKPAKPPRKPAILRDPTTAKPIQLSPIEEEEFRNRLEQVLEQKEVARPVKEWLPYIDRGRAWLRWGVIFISLIMLLFIILQVGKLYVELTRLPFATSLAFKATIWLILAALAYCGWRLISTFRRLKESPLFSLKALRDSQRALGAAAPGDAELYLTGYLQSFSVNAATQSLFDRYGLSNEKIETARLRVLELNHGDLQNWLHDIENEFLIHLDGVCDKLIASRWKRLGVLVAASPRGVIDSITVLICSWSTAEDICQIYGLRPSKLAIALILAQSFGQAVLALELDEVIESTATAVVGAGFAKVVAKPTEGLISGRLFRRLAKKIQAQVRPIMISK